MRAMPETTQTVSDVVSDLGGLAVVAEICGVGQTAVHNWRTWNRFPNRVDVLLAMQEACRKDGIPLDTDLFQSRADDPLFGAA